MGKSLPLSNKQSIEICNTIRKKPLARAKIILERVIDYKDAIPFKRFTEMGHRPGKMATGRYPIKACQAILKLLLSAESNAQLKGLNSADLLVSHIAAHKASSQWHYGRFFRRKMKRVNIEVILDESKKKSKQQTKVSSEKASSVKPSQVKEKSLVSPKDTEKSKPESKPELKSESNSKPEKTGDKK